MTLELSNLTAALSALASLVGLANKSNTVEFNQKLIELQQRLIAIQGDFATLMDENRRLKEQLDAERNYSFHHSVTWKKLADGSETGPFCPVCMSEGKEVPSRLRGNYTRGLGFQCVHDHGGTLSEKTFVLPEELIPKDRYIRK
jgi:hypothetical protein